MVANPGESVVEREAVPVPWVGAVFASLMALVAVGVTATLWSELPEVVPSGKVGLDGEPTMTSRWLFASAMPGVILLLVAVLTVGARLGAGFQRALRMPVFWSGRSLGRLLNLHLAALAAFLTAVHVVMLYSEAGRALPVSSDRLVGLFLAAFLVALGLLALVLRTRRGHDTPAVRWWNRARWFVGGGVTAVGVVTGVACVLAPDPRWAALTGVLLMPAILLGCAAPFVGNQAWRKPAA
ncbi:hypothetical protein [Nocardiopsis sp. NPDC058789]|uniref:hypothetical protein n=1 Tax=Nocardiopsis TaxID=2013 RepID=UPI0036718613